MDRRKSIELSRALREQYHPCSTGLHVVAINEDAKSEVGPHFTVVNLPAIDEATARVLFDRARADLVADDDVDPDLLVDLQVNGDHVDDFPMMRQMLPRLYALATG